ncbi:hypothetical protein AAVH_10761 [Aphelenchoides avenae]|nr:hypothetical protein AAVH_10761 [Aphelenchus avenae]
MWHRLLPILHNPFLLRAYSSTMGIYVSRQEFMQPEAEKFCAVVDHSGFVAFVESIENSYHVAHFVWNDLKNGVEGNETYLWTSGKFGFSERIKQSSWLYEYRGYNANDPETLFSSESRTVTEKEEGDCLDGHTKNYGSLYVQNCGENLLAVCYY